MCGLIETRLTVPALVPWKSVSLSVQVVIFDIDVAYHVSYDCFTLL